MRARRLRLSIAAMVVVGALGACGGGSGSSDDPTPPSSVVTTTVPGDSTLTAEMLEEICSTTNPPADVTQAPDDANAYAAVANGLARSIGERCAERHKP